MLKMRPFGDFQIDYFLTAGDPPHPPLPPRDDFIIDPMELRRRFTLEHFCVPGARLNFNWLNVREPDCYRPLPARSGEFLAIVLVLPVPDRDSGRFIEVCFTRTISSREVSISQLSGHAAITNAVRELLYSAMMHEVDESLHVDGVRVFDPHK